MLRNAGLYFVLLGALVVPAFWPSYISRFDKVDNLRVHLHGLVMGLWVVILIAQGLLIRGGRRDVHRSLGKASYVLAPLIVLSTLSLAHLRIKAAGANFEPFQLYFLWVQLFLVALFAIAYVQAIRHRHEPLVHGGYMICTALTLFDPIVARILAAYLDVDPPLLQVITYALIDGVLLWLAFWGRRQARPVTIFPAMLALFVIGELPTFFLPQTTAWASFAQWFGRLPFP